MSSSDAATAGILDEYPDFDNRSCRLLGPTALVNISLERHISDSKTHDRIDRSRAHGNLGYSIIDLQTTHRNA